MLPKFEELMAQASTGKGSDGMESSEIRADKPTVKQSRARNCAEQLVKEAENIGQGTQYVEGIYPEELSGEAASLDMGAETDAENRRCIRSRVVASLCTCCRGQRGWWSSGVLTSVSNIPGVEPGLKNQSRPGGAGRQSGSRHDGESDGTGKSILRRDWE